VSTNKRRFARGETSNGSSRSCFRLDVLDTLCHEVSELADSSDEFESEGGMSSRWLLVTLCAVCCGGGARKREMKVNFYDAKNSGREE
jgi:hypothetical protein